MIVVLGIANEPARGSMGAHAMGWMGQLSFPLYAVHLPVLTGTAWLGRCMGLPAPVSEAVAIAVAASALPLYDAPARRWRTARTGGRRTV